MAYIWVQDANLEDNGVCKNDFKSSVMFFNPYKIFVYFFLENDYSVCQLSSFCYLCLYTYRLYTTYRKYAYHEWKIAKPS